MSKKAALVTGGSDRIGKAIALQLAKLGYQIILHYNSSIEKAKATQQELETLNVKCQLLQIDFKNDRIDTNILDKVDSNFDLQILVNNASDFTPSDFNMPSDDWLHHHFNITFKSAYTLTKAFAQHKKAGLIINLLDTKVEDNDTIHLDYVLSKKLLKEFTKIAAYELAPNFRVNAIGPGLILPPPGEKMDYLREKAKSIPLQTIGDLKQIQNTVKLFVENTFLTGQIIYVDGGENL